MARAFVTGRRLQNTVRALEVAHATRVGTTPCELVYAKGTHRLLRYTRESPATWAEPVLLSYALINRPYILDLQHGKSVVRQYLDRGFDVYIIDWGVPSHADRVLTLEHYVCGFLDEAVQAILARPGHDKVHLVGYCMGGTMAALFAALEPACVKSLTLLAAPIDFSGRESLLNVWADREHFDVDAFVDAHGNCPAWFLQACFLSMKPIQNLVQKNVSMFENIEDERFLANFFAMELWVNDNIPVAGETFREFVKAFYQGNQLVRGEFHLGSRRVDLAADHLPAASPGRQGRSPRGARVDGGHPAACRQRRCRVGRGRSRPRGVGRERQGSQERLAGGDTVAREAVDYARGTPQLRGAPTQNG